MESRINEFVKSFCDDKSCSTSYIDEKAKLADKILQSKDFKDDLTRYSALSNKNRFLIYSLIKQEEMCNCVLAKTIGLSEGSISHHIKKLEQAGLIVGRNKGHFTIYYTVEQLKEEL